MPKGGKRSTSFTPETAPKGNKGKKHKRTLLKESLGLKSWDKLVSFVNNEGAEKLIEEIINLEGRDYTFAYAQVAEYVKPKLQRTTVEGNPNKPISLLTLIDGLPIDLKKQLLEHIRSTKPSV